MLSVEDKENSNGYLFSLKRLLGGSIGGMVTWVLTDDLLGCSIAAVVVAAADVRTDIEAGLPVDDERTEGVWSIKFRPN